MNESPNQNWGHLQRVGGRLCLDFINTVNRESDGYSEDWLTSYSALVAWGQHAQILSQQQATQLVELAANQPDLADAVFKDAIVLRETLYRLFSAVAANRDLQNHDLEVLNTALKEALAWRKIGSTDDGFAWSWSDSSDHLGCILWRVVCSAADLLTAEKLSRVRECSGEGCGWIFLDTSRNRSRRWCDMETCGNRAKARRYYKRSSTKGAI